ncbi:phosphopantothenate-cysteine ligase-like protein [Perilla frutescens var. hirtella]|nr:phosphopantothenate-cysteine ligase-like protein [Perilla frutescens var. frutescens]KAH6800691.1 phosphopantothenate-cysteine ligase-like protein [Perilla frutescens var. hirtella]
MFKDVRIVRPRLLYEKTIKEAISNTHVAASSGTLLKLPFTTIVEYLQILQLISSSMSSLGSSALFYLAAAVSDFYVPWESMAVHKIQSSSDPLDMRLAQVPKMLSVLRKDWVPKAFCISFKFVVYSFEKGDIVTQHDASAP